MFIDCVLEGIDIRQRQVVTITITTTLICRRLSAYLRRQHALTPIDRHNNVRRPTLK